MNIIKQNVDFPAEFPLIFFEPQIMPQDECEELTYHWHDWLEISYVKSGCGCYYVNGSIYEMSPGDIIIFNNLEPHAWRAYPPNPMIQPYIEFYPSLIWSNEIDLHEYDFLKPFTERNTNFSNKLPAHHPVTIEIYNLLTQIEKEYQEKSIGYILLIKAKLLHIMTYLIRYFQDSGKISDNISEKQVKLYRLENVLLYIKDHFDKDISLNDVAAIAHMNPNYFSTFFRNTLGLTFKDYLLRLRVSKAVSRIKNEDKTVLEIVMDCGFNNTSSFYGALRKVMGAGSKTVLRRGM